MPESVNHFEMRRLEALSNTIFGVAMTLLAYNLVSLVDCRAADHLRPLGFVWRHARCCSALFLSLDRARWIERHPLASCWTGARPTECGDRNGVHDHDLYFGDLLCVDRPANLHREIHLVLRLCNANDRWIPRKAQTEPNNMTSPQALTKPHRAKAA
jgi:hypothetical protein